MLIEVSIGEAVDKYSILELKQKKITDRTKVKEIEKELTALSICKPYIEKMSSQYKWLTYINEKIWNMTDIIKSTSVNDPNFSTISNSIFENNQKRFRIKSFFNDQSNSVIQEQKSYASTICIITIDSLDTFYFKLPEINYLSIQYDFLFFACDDEIIMEDTIYAIYTGKHILRNTILNKDNKNIIQITLSEYNIVDDREIFDFDELSYISGGCLGDFIQTTSVVAEIFYLTGKRGILYISEKYGADIFRNGLENTYKDTYEMIKNQVWCKAFLIEDSINMNKPLTVINLNQWRKSQFLYRTNWYNIFKHTYCVEWAKHTWLSLPKTHNHNHICKNKILINMTSYRFSDSLNFDLLVDTYGVDAILFITNCQDDYNMFKKNYKCNVPCYTPTSFTDLCTAIKLCKLFVGGLSAPLTIAHAFFVDRVICLTGSSVDDIHNTNYPYWYNIHYEFLKKN